MGTLANTVQLAGAVVTFVGLLHAHERARYGPGYLRARLGRLWNRLRGIQPPTPEGRGDVSYEFRVGPARGETPLFLDESVSTDERLSQLADYVRRLANKVGDSRRDVDGLGRELERAATDARAGDADTLAQAKQADAGRESAQNRTQRVDLSIAIGGLAISVVGLFLNYCA